MSVRVGFLGAGFIARYHRDMLSAGGADAEVVAVHDPDLARAAGFAEGTPTQVCSTEEEVIDASDAVYVATWTAEHPRLVVKVAAAGRAVFCEKPLATDLVGALDMAEAVRRAGVVNQVGLVLRDSPAFLYLRHLIDRPDSGRVMSVVFRDDQYLPVQGIYGSTWRADPARAGSGTLLEHSIHDLDLLEWMLGPVTTAAGQSRRFHGIDGIEDVMVATLAFESGALASLVSVWHDVLARPSARRVEVFCERAWYGLEGDHLGPISWMIDRDDDGSRGTDEGSLAGADLQGALAAQGVELRNADRAFIDAVRADRRASPDLADALRAHALADAIYLSADHPPGESAAGAPVVIPNGTPDRGWVQMPANGG